MSGKKGSTAKERASAPLPPPEENTPLPERALILREAERLITGDRNYTYGEPDADFTRTAALWSALFDRPFTGHEVAMAMAALKLSRLSWSPGRQDSWVDLAGYAGCGWETAVMEERRKAVAW